MGRRPASGRGALTTLAELEPNPVMRQRYTAQALAASRVATAQIRNADTLGGNLRQDSRRPYYRGPWRCYPWHRLRRAPRHQHHRAQTSRCTRPRATRASKSPYTALGAEENERLI